jgi:hypothetical protein
VEVPTPAAPALPAASGAVLALPTLAPRTRPDPTARIPSASACSQARCHASAWVDPRAYSRFSPFAPLTIQQPAVPVSPMDQPARCRRSKDSSGLG